MSKAIEEDLCVELVYLEMMLEGSMMYHVVLGGQVGLRASYASWESMGERGGSFGDYGVGETCVAEATHCRVFKFVMTADRNVAVIRGVS